jgi:serine/threonine-protein kinase
MSAENRNVVLIGAERLMELTSVGERSDVVVNDRPYGYATGDVIASKYRLVRMIGKGGMGVVWEAHSDALDIRVAIKLIPSTLSNAEDQKRLIYEAQAVARLVDPAIVRVFDCGKTSRGEPYVVMELLVGHDLASRLDERGRLLPVEAVRTLLPIIRALGIAHDANIVHRDVKPENVFLTKTASGEEQPKLLDFGLAKVDLSWDKRLTHAGAAMGSPCYMSPEQARGEEVDRRADLWAFCVVLYETISGQLPFDGDTYNAIMYSILSAPVLSLPELSIDEPELWGILSRGFERDRELRWQTSAELLGALSDWLIERGIFQDISGVSLRGSKNRSFPNERLAFASQEQSNRETQRRYSSHSNVTLSRVVPVDLPAHVKRRKSLRITLGIGCLVLLGSSYIVWNKTNAYIGERTGKDTANLAPVRPASTNPHFVSKADQKEQVILKTIAETTTASVVPEPSNIATTTTSKPNPVLPRSAPKKASASSAQDAFKNPFE